MKHGHVRGVEDDELRGAGLSILLKPEGSEQRRQRLAVEATASMALEDKRSKQVGEGVTRLDKEKRERIQKREKLRAALRLAEALFTVKVNAVGQTSPLRIMLYGKEERNDC